MTDRDRIIRFARRFHARSGGTEFPTVRRVSSALSLKQSIITDECFVEPLMLTAYFTLPEPPLGEHFVEICE